VQKAIIMAMLLAWLAAPALAAPTAAEQMAARIAALKPLLNETQLQALQIPFDDEARIGWSFLPGERRGLKLNDLTQDQHAAVLSVFEAGLSEKGFKKVEAIRSLEYVLRELEPGSDAYRDPGKYALAVFGDPQTAAPWGVRWEGHHLSLNWTVIDNKIISSTPQFLGSNPATVKSGSKKGLRLMAVEEDIARALLKSLDETQRAACILGDTAPADIITRMDREALILEDKGVAYGDLSPEQQGMMQTLIDEYAHVQAPELAEARISRLKEAGLNTVKFAWMGGLESGQGHYYRIQGPTFLIEYDNTQNEANHIHTVWRDFNNDFGRDLLLEHYKSHRKHDHPHKHDH